MTERIRSRRRLKVTAWSGTVAVLAWGFATFIAMLSTILGSFKTTVETTLNPLALPHHLSLTDYRAALAGPSLGESFWTYARNSCMACGTGVLLAMVCGTAAAAGIVFGPRQSRGRESYCWLLLLIPGVVTWVPLFSLMERLNLLSNPLGLGFVYAALATPLVTLLMRSYFLAVPEDLIGAAQLDGAALWIILVRVVLPLTAAQLFAVAFFVGLAAWSELALALILLVSPSSQTLPVGLLQFRTEFSVQLGPQCAGICMALLPFAISYVLWQGAARSKASMFPISP